MKKLLLIGFIICTMPSLQAQEQNTYSKNKTTFGIKGGVIKNSISNYTGYGLYAGLFSNTRFNKKWSIQNEINIVADGYLYVEIPVVLKYHISEKWSVFAGPKIDFLISDDSTQLTKTHFNTIGLSVDVGMQYNLSKKLFVEARYGYNFTNQLESIKYPTRNRQTFRIGLGYKF